MKKLCALALTLTLAASAEEVLPIFQRTNSVQTDAALEPMRPTFANGTVRVLSEGDQQVLTGTIVSADGYFLTKASEAPTSPALKVIIADGSSRTARVVHRAYDLDLLLAKMDTSGADPVEWSSIKDSQLGDWVISATAGLNEQGKHATVLRLGVISAQTRSIPASRAALGIEVADIQGHRGAEVASVWPDSPAARAGVTEGDRVIAIQDTPIGTAAEMRDVLSAHKAGQSVDLSLNRKGKAVSVSIRLGSYSRVSLTAAGEDYANGGVSLRTDGYRKVLQHDMPLKTRDMGGPLVDLDGHCLGINIARVDRISTFALPAEVFWSEAQVWMNQDRSAHPEVIKKALPVAVATAKR